MLPSSIVLCTKDSIGDDFLHAILTQDFEGWPCGAPIVYSAGAELERGNSLITHVLFTPNQAGAGREILNTPTSIMRPARLKPLAKNHKVMTVSSFRPSKYKHLREYIGDVGGISFIIADKVGRVAVPSNLQKFINNFRHSCLFYYNAWGNKFLDGKDDAFACVITLLDLPYCVPLFNMRRVDGVGVSVSAVTIKASESMGHLHRLFQFDFVLSNFSDNIFTIDGATLNAPNLVRPELLSELGSMLSKELEVRSVPKTKDKLSKKKSSYYEKWRERNPEMEKWKKEALSGPGYKTGYISHGGEEITFSDHEAAEPTSIEVPTEWTTNFDTSNLIFSTDTGETVISVTFTEDSEIDQPEDEEPFPFQNEEGN
jgi:hypothetical protein